MGRPQRSSAHARGRFRKSPRWARSTSRLGLIISTMPLAVGTSISMMIHSIGDWTFDGTAEVAVLPSNSWDESNWNSLKASYGYTPVYDCWFADKGNTWGSVAPYNPQSGGHWNVHKVCIWPSRVPNYNNPSGWHYYQLTIQHELGHVLSLGDDTDGDACLMRDGYAMTIPCSSELNYVRGHYNRW